MTIQVDATFENGAFRPISAVKLQEGTHVLLTIETQKTLAPPERLVAALAEVAALPAQSPSDNFSGADHDAVLYGPEGAR